MSDGVSQSIKARAEQCNRRNVVENCCVLSKLMLL